MKKVIFLLLMVVSSFVNAGIIETVYFESSEVSYTDSSITINVNDFTVISEYPCYGYSIEILDGGQFIPGTATNNYFPFMEERYIQNELIEISFYGGPSGDYYFALPAGEPLVMSFDIEVYVDGPIFGVVLERNATIIPEPISLSMIALGAIGVIRKRR